MKKILIAIISVFVLPLIPTTSTLVVSSKEYIENDIYSEDMRLNSINYSWCLILVSCMGSISPNNFFNFRKHLTFIYELGSTYLYEIFKGKYHYFGGEYISGELNFFTGFIISDDESFTMIGFTRYMSIY